jgi:kynurenine aminotransferase
VRQYDVYIEQNRSHSSIAEAFAATGWRIGYLIGPPSIIKPTLAATTRIVFSCNSPMQEAAAAGLEQANERGFFEKQRAEYAERRAVLIDAFERLGLKYTLPQGTYFALLVSVYRDHIHYRVYSSKLYLKWQDISSLRIPDDYPFPKVLEGRGKDFKSVTLAVQYSSLRSIIFRACWFMAYEVGVSAIPVSEAS